MTHGIRTPLNAILGYAQILERDSNLSSSQTLAANTIYNSGLSLLESINKVYPVSQICTVLCKKLRDTFC